MVSINTDIDLSKTFKDPVSDDYKTALEFLTVNPDYSLLKFRDIIFSLCVEIANYKKLDFKNNKLFDRIEYLFESKIIDKQFKDKLHKARMLGNSGAHKPILSFSEDKEFFEKRKKTLNEKAKTARKLVVEIFENVYLLINNVDKIPSVDYVSVGAQEYKEILFEAATTLSDKVKLKAGIIYESIAKESVIDAPLVVSSNFSYHYKSLYKLAASYYEASYKISADLDKKLFLSGQSLDSDNIINQYCELEPLFKYSVIASEGTIGEEHIRIGYDLMKVAADRGYSPAEAHYGAYLYQKKEYQLAKEYIDKASEKDESLAFRFLFYYFSDGFACKIDKGLALEYLNKGISLGCPDSMATLGEAYHKGIVVEKDDVKAEKILKKAIEAGSLMAQRYFIVEFNDLAGQFADRCKAVGEKLQQAIEDAKSKPIRVGKKIGPNEKCPCGSGKKYKKCCRNKPNNRLQLNYRNSMDTLFNH